MEFVAEPVVTTMDVANRVKVNQLGASQESEMPVSTSFLMSSPRICQVCHLTETSSL
jgi:hypothetical protein